MFSIPPSSQDPRTFAIIGAAYEAHRVLGAGFLEIFYKDALAIELNLRSVPFQTEVLRAFCAFCAFCGPGEQPLLGLLWPFVTYNIELE